jgi:predicted Zn-dependent protease
MFGGESRQRSNVLIAVTIPQNQMRILDFICDTVVVCFAPKKRHHPDGLSYLEKAQRMTPDSWATYFYRGKAQFQQHDTAAAVRQLRQAVEMNPEDAGSFYLLARALRSQGPCARGGRGHATRGATAYHLAGRGETCS